MTSSEDNSSSSHVFADDDQSGYSFSENDDNSRDYRGFRCRRNFEDILDEEDDEEDDHSSSQPTTDQSEAFEDEPIEEILEENNNDPNNNLGDENDEDVPIVVNIPTSPQPGCSKDFDAMESSSSSGTLTNAEINRLANQILKLVSRLTYESIVSALERAQNSGNKIITLLDLLPDDSRRTFTLVGGIKRGNHEDICCIEMKRANHNERPTTPHSPIISGFVINNPIIDLTNREDYFNPSPPEIILDSPDPVIRPAQLSPVSHGGENGPRGSKNPAQQSSASIASNPMMYAPRSSKLPKLPMSPILKPSTLGSTQGILGIETVSVNPATQANSQRPSTSKQSQGAIPKAAVNRQLLHPNNIPVSLKNALATVTSNNSIERAKQLNYAREFDRQATALNAFKANAQKLIDLKAKTHQPLPSTTATFPHKIAGMKDKFEDLHQKKKNEYREQQVHGPRHGSIVIANPAKLALPGHVPSQSTARPDSTQVKPATDQCQRAEARLTIVREPAAKRPVVDQRQQAEARPTTVTQLAPQRPAVEERPQFIARSTLSTSENDQVCQEIYQKLRAMFPDIERNYIKKFCPSEWTPGVEHDVQFANIVDRLLANEASWQLEYRQEYVFDRATTSNNTGNGTVPNVDETCEYLAGIFPDADPHYLRTAAMGFKDQNAVKAFVDQKLQKPDYPTREQYMAKLKITQEQERYTTNFVVADFVKIFPDPFSHFEDAKRKCEYNLVAAEFLKSFFSRLRVATISKAYSESHYNLSLAAKRLNLCHDFMKSRRCNREMPTEDIPLLQEMAFIRHQDTIHEYIKSMRAQENIEFQNLKASGGLLQCQCCYDEECMPSKCSTCDNGHIFCNSCVITGTDSRLGDGETHVLCFLDCGREFSLSTLQKIIPPTKFSILLKKRQAAEVMAAGLEGLVSCPFCHFASIPAEGDKVFKCLNPECMKESCIQCKEPNHVPLRCNEVEKQDKARKYIEEKMTQALARTCYKCKKSFFKDEGCNKITCPCGAIMCFICDKPIKDYSHFRGQGSNDANKCPLWSDNNRLNAEAVRKVAEEARSELLRADPTLNIDTEGLAPALPPPTVGPHNDILGAENIAVQLAARVMRDNR